MHISNHALQASGHVVSREIGGREIVFDALAGHYFELKGSAAEIWQLACAGLPVTTIVETIADQHQQRTAVVEPDVERFVDAACAQGLLERIQDVEGHATPPSGVLRIGQTRLMVHGAPADLKVTFDANHYLHLRDLLAPRLLALVSALVDDGEFVDRHHDGIGNELCLVPGRATAVLQLLFNDPALRHVAAEIGGHDKVGCFDGRVYRMSPREGHYDSWHSDAGEDRLIAVSLNLSRERYDGGALEMRRASAKEAEWTVDSEGFGSAVMFRISPTLRHRVNAVTGLIPRTAYAGWFRAVPAFEDLFLPTLDAQPTG